MSESEREPTSTKDPTNPVALREDEWYYDRKRQALFAVRENTITFDPDAATYTGELTVELHDDGRTTYDGTAVSTWRFPGTIVHVPARVVDEPLVVVLEYGAARIREAEATLGTDHEYTDLDGVQRIGDLSLALAQLDL